MIYMIVGTIHGIKLAALQHQAALMTVQLHVADYLQHDTILDKQAVSKFKQNGDLSMIQPDNCHYCI